MTGRRIIKSAIQIHPPLPSTHGGESRSGAIWECVKTRVRDQTKALRGTKQVLDVYLAKKLRNIKKKQHREVCREAGTHCATPTTAAGPALDSQIWVLFLRGDGKQVAQAGRVSGDGSAHSPVPPGVPQSTPKPGEGRETLTAGTLQAPSCLRLARKKITRLTSQTPCQLPGASRVPAPRVFWCFKPFAAPRAPPQQGQSSGFP